jgi:hypothetical protein
MRELDAVRRVAPPVDPPAPEAVARMRARALGRGRRRPARSRGWLLAPLAIGAALALVVVLIQAGGGNERAFAAEAVRAAEGAPRLLPGSDWRVTRVDEWSAGTGEMTFARGAQELQLRWFPARVAGAEIGPAKDPNARFELEFGVYEGGVQQVRARVWRYEGSNEYTAVWRHGEATVEARGAAPSAAAFAGVVESLRRVGVEDWLRALPADAVTPQEHRDAVDEMLAGLPLPPGLDVAKLREGAATRDRYQLGAEVAGAVACGWFATWAQAKAAGDDAGVRRAVAALTSSRDWAILREMSAQGDYPRVLRMYTDAVAGDGTVMAGKELSVEESYRDALCR